MIDTGVTGTDLTDTDLTDTGVTSTDLTDTDLTDTGVTDTDLVDSDLTDTSLTDTICFSRGPSTVEHLLKLLLTLITCGDTRVTPGRVGGTLPFFRSPSLLKVFF